MGGACSKQGYMQHVYIILVGKPKLKCPIRRPTFRWEDNTQMDLTDIG